MSGLMTAKKAIERVREIQEKNEGAEKEWDNAKEDKDAQFVWPYTN